MTYPLSAVDPTNFEPLDQGEIQLMCSGAYDLILIENATEVFRQVMMYPGIIEHVLNSIVSSTQKCVTFPSETFEFLNPEKYAMQIVQYHQRMYELSDRLPPCVVAVVALDLGKAGGHYGALWYKHDASGSRNVEVFDSMAAAKKGSYYTPQFKKLAKDIFSVPQENVTNPACVNMTMMNSLQFTGGFPENNPAILETKEGKRLSPVEKQAIRSQATESQNHFCYMWAIWYIHLEILGYTVKQIVDHLTTYRLDPLFVIKRYSYNLVRLLNLDQYMQHAQFFHTYFPKVWTNAIDPYDPQRLSLNFSCYELEMTPAQNMDECFFRSIQPGRVTIQNKTSMPRDFYQHYCH